MMEQFCCSTQKNGKVKEFTLERADTYGFRLLDSWMGVNELKFSSYKKSKRRVSSIEFFFVNFDASQKKIVNKNYSKFFLSTKFMFLVY
jgi:hypothetical protein